MKGVWTENPKTPRSCMCRVRAYFKASKRSTGMTKQAFHLTSKGRKEKGNPDGDGPLPIVRDHAARFPGKRRTTV